MADDERASETEEWMTEDDNLAGYEDILTGEREGPNVFYGKPVPPAVLETGQDAPLGLANTVFVVAILYFGKNVILPVTLGMLLCFVLSPLVRRLQRLGLSRVLAVLTTVALAFVLIGAAGAMVWSQAATLAANAPRYAHTIENKMDTAQIFMANKLGALDTLTETQAFRHPGVSAPVQPAPPKSMEPVGKSSIFATARSIAGPFLGPLGTAFIVLVVAIFALIQKEDVRDRMIRLMGANDLYRATLALNDAGSRLSHYFLSQLIVNAGFGTIIAMGVWAVGVPSPAVWGIFAGLLRFVPYIGSSLAAATVIALGAAIDPGWSTAIWVLLLFAVVETLVGYAVEPLLYGHSTGLSPIAVVVAALFWTWLWGPVGLILSTPLTLCLVVISQHVKRLEFFDILLGNRPALTPTESFYQRILADDPDEALSQAELILGERTLTDYYDNVVVTGLRISAGRIAAGTISSQRAERFSHTMLEVIGDLKRLHPVPRRQAGDMRAACVVGPGPYAATIAAIVEHLLSAHCTEVRIIPNAQVQRATISALDLGNVDVIMLCTLDSPPTTARIRYLVQRLRDRAPQARVVFGLVERPFAVASPPDIHHYVATLEEAMAAFAAET